jgi:hypothetical protein
MTVLFIKKPRNKNDFEVCNYFNYLVISLDNFCQDELCSSCRRNLMFFEAAM